MKRYLARKVLIYLVTFFVAVTIDWAIPRFMPGDPIERLLSRMQAQPAAQEALTGYYTEAFGFDVPIWEQYLNFWKALLQGDLGRSVSSFPTPVSDLILGALPYTIALLVPAIVLSFWAGNKVGALAARRVPGVANLHAIDGRNDVVVAGAADDGVGGEIADGPRQHVAVSQPLRGIADVVHYPTGIRH